MIDKIKNELRRRLEASEDGMIEIKMRKSGDVVIITASRAAADPLCIFQIKSFKLQAVYALGYYELAMEIADYDQTVEKQQNLILDLYNFEREKLDSCITINHPPERKKHMAYDKKQDEEKEIEEKANELRRLLRDPDVMHEILKDAYIPAGRSTADMLDEVLQDTDMFGDSKDEA